MEVELGFQANCSELVTHLGLTNREDILKALTNIAVITGWNWWVEVANQHIRIPTEGLNDLVFVRDNQLGIGGKKLLLGFEKELGGDALMEISREPKDDWLYYLELVWDAKKATIPGDPFNSSLTAIKCNCGIKGLSIELNQHHQVEKMPAFHAIRMAYDSDLAIHDGGTEADYLTWIAYHFFDKKATIERVIASGNKEKIKEHVEQLERYPPLDRSKAIPPKDMELVIDMIFD